MNKEEISNHLSRLLADSLQEIGEAMSSRGEEAKSAAEILAFTVAAEYYFNSLLKRFIKEDPDSEQIIDLLREAVKKADDEE